MVLYKEEFETINLTLDFKTILGKEKIKNRVLTAIDTSDDSDASQIILDPSKQVDTKQTSHLWVRGGKLGHRYRIEMIVDGTKHSKAILVADILVVVRR